MSRWSNVNGATGFPVWTGKGAASRLKAQKRIEAEQRQATSDAIGHHQSKAHRLGRCACPKP